MTEPPEPTTAREMLGDQAIKMAEMVLILADLKSCIRSLKIIKRDYLREPLTDEQRYIKMALFRDAVILYVGAFIGTGIKLDPNEVHAHMTEWREFFQWARDLRDAYAAHTFGSARQCVATVVIDPATGKSAGVGPFWQEWDPVNSEAVEQLGAAASVAANYAASLADSINDELSAAAAQMTPGELSALPLAQIHVPGPAELRTERHTFRRQKTGQAKPPKPRRVSS